jgi:hypothetical protein
MIISLSPSIQRSTDITSVEVFSVTDKPSDKIVIADVSIENVGQRSMVLWANEEYDAIGQWSDDAVRARVLELVRALFP